MFGDGYSGLEYDYRGLLRLYSLRGDLESAAHYQGVLTDWSALRGQVKVEVGAGDLLLDFDSVPSTCEEVVREFFANA